MNRKAMLADAGLYFLIGVIYLSNYPLWSASDTIGTKYLPISFLLEGNLDLTEFPHLARSDVTNLQWATGKLRSTYPVGTAILATPVYALGHLFGISFTDGGADRLARISADLITLAAVIFLHRLFLRLAPRSKAAMLTLAMALGTSLWSICSDDLWQHTGVILALSIFLHLLDWSRPASPIRRFCAGAALGFAVFCRPTTGIFALIFLTWLIPAGIRAVIQASCGVAFTASWHVIYNLSAYGSLLGGYTLISSQIGWNAPDPKILLNLLIYPSRGLLIYCPILILALGGIKRGLLGTGAPLYRLCLLGVTAQFVLISSWRIWDGGVNYGPRLLTDALPFFGVLMAPGYLSLSRSRWGDFLTAPLLCLSIAIQALGVFRYDGSYLYRFGGDFKTCEILYVATGGMNEILWPQRAECVAAPEVIRFSDPATRNFQVFGFRGDGLVNPRALVAFNPQNRTDRLQLVIEPLDVPGLEGLELELTVNEEPIMTVKLTEPGKKVPLDLNLPKSLEPGTINVLDCKFNLRRSNDFNFVGEYNTVHMPVARLISLIVN